MVKPDDDHAHTLAVHKDGHTFCTTCGKVVTP
jgi:uncharacterized Zn finger protein (UPF0148 family)